MQTVCKQKLDSVHWRATGVLSLTGDHDRWWDLGNSRYLAWRRKGLEGTINICLVPKELTQKVWSDFSEPHTVKRWETIGLSSDRINPGWNEIKDCSPREGLNTGKVYLERCWNVWAERFWSPSCVRSYASILVSKREHKINIELRISLG